MNYYITPTLGDGIGTNTVTEGQTVTVELHRTSDSDPYLDQNFLINTYNPNPSDSSNATPGRDYQEIKDLWVGIPSGQMSASFTLKTYNDTTLESPEDIFFNINDFQTPGGVITKLNLKDSQPVLQPQSITVKMLDPSITVTEGQTAVIRMAISGNDRGGSFQLPFDSAGAQILPSIDFTNDNPTYDAYKISLTPGQTYAEFRMNMTEDTLRENDKTNTFGAVRNNDASFTPYTADTSIRFEGTTAVTLRDNDWGTAPTNPSVVINGNNNIINQNTYVDNRVYTNSFNVSDSYNQTYTNSFNGSGGKDTITGTTGNDQLAGLKGNDVLRGAQGNDSVIGGAGNDNLFGGLGRNILDGGTGRDIYNVATETNAAQADILKNFAATDRINIIGATNLTFQSMQDGIGIFNNGVLQALTTGGVGLDAVRNATTAV